MSNTECHMTAGPGDLPSWFLGDFAALLCDPVCDILNASLRKGSIHLEKANIIPVPKSPLPNSMKLN